MLKSPLFRLVVPFEVNSFTLRSAGVGSLLILESRAEGFHMVGWTDLTVWVAREVRHGGLEDL